MPRLSKSQPCCVALVLIWAAASLRAQTPTARFPIEAAAVEAALEATGTTVPPGGVQVPASLTSSVARPTLLVQSREPVGPQRERFRLVCKEPGACLPFYATLTLPASAAPLTLPRQALTTAGTVPLRPGDHITLVLSNHFMRISLPVVLIDTGHTGSEVRVASLDRKHTWRGLVGDDGSVHGDLP